MFSTLRTPAREQTLSMLTIEEIGRISREYRATDSEIAAQRLSLADGLRPHEAKMDASDSRKSMIVRDGTIIVSAVSSAFSK